MIPSEEVQVAVDALRGGGLFVHPTETVYGLGGLLGGPAPELLRTMKKRPSSGFVVLLPDEGFAAPLLSPLGRDLANAFWPGPLTLVVTDTEDRFPRPVKAHDGSVALRVCGNPITTAFLEFLGEPVTSTSANLPGEPPARTFQGAKDAAATLGVRVRGLDGGILAGGPPSTLIDVRREAPEVLREGGVPVTALRPFLNSPRAERT